MLGRILRQYRRWLFGSAMLFVYAMLELVFFHRFAASDPGYYNEFSQPLQLVSLLLAVIIIAGVLTLVLALFFPTLLGMIETLGMSIVISSAIAVILPVAMQNVWVDIFLLFAVQHVLINILSGQYPLLSLPSTARLQAVRFQTTAAPDKVWNRLYPVPGQLDAYFVPGVQVLAAPEGTGADFLCITPQRKDLGDKAELYFVDNYQPFTSFSVRFKLLSDAAPSAAFNTMEAKIEPRTTGGSDVTITCIYANAIFGQRFNWFLVDAVRDARACYQARIEGRRDWSIWGTQLPKAAR